jgi:hypothetical protein
MRGLGKSMNKIFRAAILTVVSVVVTAAFSLAGTTAQPGQTLSASEIKASLDKAPKAVFPQPKFEFDPVFEGTEIEHDFVVENAGEAPLVITNIRPD